MAYLGRQPIIGNYQVLDAITATTTDTYALTKNSVAVFPQTPANCIVSLNGVIQAPTDSYTISGSNIVFASALTGSDSIDFITVLGDVLNVGTVSDGTIGLAKLSATGTKDATTFLRGDNTFQTIGTNTPIIFATGSVTSMTNGVDTKITLGSEIIDTDGVFASSRFTATTAGKYKVTAVLSVNLSVATASLNLFIKKNGTTITTGIAKSNEGSANTVSAVANIIVSLSATDYIELFGSHNNGTTVNTNTGIYTNLSIIKLVE
jgi:hypothetical protein